MSVLLAHWSAPLGVFLPVAISLWLYERGLSRIGRSGGTSPEARSRERSRRQQAWLFRGGLLSLLVALASPIDYWSGILFWPHMLQHLILLYLAAPLVVLGAPWLPLVRGLPAPLRRPVLTWIYRTPGGRALRSVSQWLFHPVTATIGLLGGFLAWHIPGAFDLALRYRVVHDAEHATFLLVGVWWWGQIVGSHPYSPRWAPLNRVWAIAAVLFVNWFVAIGMAFSSHVWFPAYIPLAAGHMGALADQQLAAAIMWVVPMIPLGITAFWALNSWLAHEEDDEWRLRALIASTRAAMAAGDEAR